VQRARENAMRRREPAFTCVRWDRGRQGLLRPSVNKTPCLACGSSDALERAVCQPATVTGAVNVKREQPKRLYEASAQDLLDLAAEWNEALQREIFNNLMPRESNSDSPRRGTKIS